MSGVIAASIPAAAVVLWLYRVDLLGPVPEYSKVLAVVKEYKITDWNLMAKAGVHTRRQAHGAADLFYVYRLVL